MNRVRFSLRLAAALVLAGCGGERERYDPLEEALAATYDVDVCGLLTAADIDSVVAVMPGEPEPAYYEDATLCSWRRADDFGVALVDVAVTDAIAETYEEYLENSEVLLGYRATPEQAQRVEGPGDFAVWVLTTEGGLFQFFVGGHMVQVSVRPPQPDSAVAMSRALAGIIYRRLP